MSILLITGTTGFVGQHVLEAALASPSFSKVFSVTRRPIPSDSPHKGNIKLEEIILEDEAQWLQWPPSVLQRIGHIDACIWSQGVVASKGSDSSYVRKISIDYSVAGIRALLDAREQSKASNSTGTIEHSENINSGEPTIPLRFIYVSGSMTERDPAAELHFLSDFRKARGAGEVAILDLEKEVGRNRLQVNIAKCGGIIPNEPSRKKTISPSVFGGAAAPQTVPVSNLLETLFAVAVKGSEKSDLSNDDLCNGLI